MSSSQVEQVENRVQGEFYQQKVRAKEILTKEFLYDEIINKKKPAGVVAKETGFSRSTINNLTQKYEIHNKYSLDKRRTHYYSSLITKEFIEKEHIEGGKSLENIAKELNMAYSTLNRRVKKLGFVLRDCIQLTEEQKLNLRWEHLTPLRKHITAKGETRHNNYIFKCSCGKLVSIDWYKVLNGIRTKCNRCDWHEGIGTSYWNMLINSAKKRGLEFKITKQYVWSIFIVQNEKCIYTGIPIVFNFGKKGSASIDRIDNNKGYIEGNIQIVHKSINRMRGSTDVELFKYLCTLVANNCTIDISQYENKKFIQVKNTTNCVDIDEE